MPNALLRTATIALGLTALAVAASLSACTIVPPVVSGRAPNSAPATPGAMPTAKATAFAPSEAAPKSGDLKRPAGWSEESHSNDVDPNYDVVFPIDAVNTITITIAPDDWAAMQADMEEINAPSLPIREAILAAGPGLTMEERLDIMKEVIAAMAAAQAAADSPITATAGMTSTGAITTAAVLTGSAVAPAGGEGDASKRSPMWVPATITFRNQVWTHVGVRYKGVSSLNTPWMLGEMRLPFKFDFDEFEDDYPEIKNQRFFGFKQLSLANNHLDPAGMRDTLVYDLLEEAGLPSLQTAPYGVVLDYGEGPTHLGLYTVVEVVDDTGVPAYFGSDDGNLYEGDGLGATLSTEHADKIVASFEKKNNEAEADWSDIWALYEVLHDDSRTSDPEAWRADLEAVFDVDTFLEWLGISAIVGHWDTYGPAAHNFYLYNNPETGQLTWFSWDHNLTFKRDMLRDVTLDKPSDPDLVPLTGFLLGDPVYFARYKELLAGNFAGVAAPEAVIAKIHTYAGLIAPYAAGQMPPAEYNGAVQELIDFVELRAPDIEDFLARQK